MDYEECSEQEWQLKLSETLDNIESAGDFATTVHFPRFVNPGLELEGDTDIPLPLSVRDAEILKSLCRQAPFGRGDQTVVDTSVRKTWELDSSKVRLTNPAWEAFLAEVIIRISDGLGIASVEARPHKLLLYEEGSFFKRHKDSEKETGMVGTLVICLPSQHQGGDVCLSFGSKTLTFTTAPTSAFDLTALAWFSDVTHEVKPLTKGYRLALTYKLVQTGMSGHSAIQRLQQSQHLHHLLRKWVASMSKMEKLVYPLEHTYTISSLSLQNMKGRDRAVAQALQSVCDNSGLWLFFAHMTHSKNEEDAYYQLDEDSTTLSTIISCAGDKVAEEVNVEEDEILGHDIYASDRDPDSEDEGEFTGNESMAASFRYHDTVALLVPRKKLHTLLFRDRDRWRYASNTSNANLVSLVIEDLHNHPDDAVRRKQAISFLTMAVSTCALPSKLLLTIMALAIDVDEAPLYCDAVKVCDVQAAAPLSTVVARRIERDSPLDELGVWDKWLAPFFTTSSLATFTTMCSVLSSQLQSEHRRRSLATWKRSKISRDLRQLSPMGVNMLDFFTTLIKEHRNGDEWTMTELLPTLVSHGSRQLICQVLSRVCTNNQQEDAGRMFKYIIGSAASQLAFSKHDLENIRIPKIGSTIDGEQYTALIDRGLSLGAFEEINTLISLTYENLVGDEDSLLNQAHRSPIRAADNALCLLLALQSSLSRHNTHAIGSLADLIRLLLQQTRQKLGEYPTKLPGWRHKPRSCGQGDMCKDGAELNKFLLSQDDMVWRFSASLSRRQHLVHHLPGDLFKLNTEKRGLPHTLVVIKLGKEFDQQLARYNEQLRSLQEDLQPLKGHFLLDLLGQEKYDELVCLNSSTRPPATSGVTSLKRPAELITV